MWKLRKARGRAIFVGSLCPLIGHPSFPPATTSNHKNTSSRPGRPSISLKMTTENSSSYDLNGPQETDESDENYNWGAHFDREFAPFDAESSASSTAPSTGPGHLAHVARGTLAHQPFEDNSLATFNLLNNNVGHPAVTRRPSLSEHQPPRMKRRLSYEDVPNSQKRPRTDDTNNDNTVATPEDDNSLALADSNRTSSSYSPSSTVGNSPDATLPPATPGDKNDADQADTSEEVEPVAALDTSEDKSTPSSSATEPPSVNIDTATLSAAPGSALSSAPVSTIPTASVQGAVGPSVSASVPTPMLQSSITNNQFVPNVPPGTVTVAAGVMANTLGITLELPPNIASHYRRILSNLPPPAMVASMAAAAPLIPAPAAPTVVAPPMANAPATIVAPAIAPLAAPVPPATAPPPVALPPATLLATAPPTIAALTGAPAQPAYALWQSTLPATVSTATWGIDYTSGEPIDTIFLSLFLHTVNNSKPGHVAFSFKHPGNPHATPPTEERHILLMSASPVAMPSYNGFVAFRKHNYRAEVMRSFPYTSIRALGQGKFEHIFHARVSPNSSKMWECPHCGDVFKGQPMVLGDHFLQCDVLLYIEGQVAAANP
ncbi:hypothetical protein CYLTODRAFT_447718 [Cylindrobasidium torrendii FP15055 ss-10]|uniref:Uncharacterized protein n=1 Tax=Cylindrobasidium torrendii FP15055 ss-10 TaxID=1314674 RepID=A0A0D7AT70_9AGAR|nr:hypothetical protein CYLTODRAFT_447718 [Cylindrobasidium torrendii FP15055 ss-10]